MHRILGVALAALAVLAGCASQTDPAAQASAAAVAADLATLEQQLQASGAAVTPAEFAALNKAIADANAGARELAVNAVLGSTVLATIEADVAALKPFLPAIAVVIGALATPVSPEAAPAPAYPAIAQLQIDMANLRAAS